MIDEEVAFKKIQSISKSKSKSIKEVAEAIIITLTEE